MRIAALLLIPLLAAADWPMLGGTPARNPVNHVDRNIPTKFDPEKDCLWKADLGSWISLGGPVVAGGKVFVGTDNQRPRNKRDQRKLPDGQLDPKNLGVLMCFEEKTGKFLWQGVFDEHPPGILSDRAFRGILSTPAVEGDRLYFVSSDGQVVCADVNGLIDGRQGKVIREKYSDPTDADIHWMLDMRKELGVVAHSGSNCSPLIVGDLVFVCTSNGVDEGHFNIPAPQAPSFIAINKKTGKLVWKDNSPGRDIMHGQWSSPAYTADPVPQVIFAGGDGWLYSFDPPTGKLLWKFDVNPKDGVYELGGTGDKNDCVAPPVIHNGRLYIGVGQDPEHTDGIGRFWCLDIKKATENGAKRADRDVSPERVTSFEKPKRETDRPKVTTKPNPGSAGVWCFSGKKTHPFDVREFKMYRTMGSACVVDDVVYVVELTGFLQCLDAKTGKEYWKYDTKASIWFGPTYVDGKILFGNDSGDLHVFKHVKNPEPIPYFDLASADEKAAGTSRRARQQEVRDKYLLARIPFNEEPIRSVPCVANGVLYVMTEKTLYAIGKK